MNILYNVTHVVIQCRVYYGVKILKYSNTIHWLNNVKHHAEFILFKISKIQGYPVFFPR
jgi:hypothetical protein